MAPTPARVAAMNPRSLLDYYTPVRPSPRDQSAFRVAEYIARELGVKFEQAEFEIFWWQKGSNERFGFTVRDGTKPVPVWLATGGSVEQIISTAGHELKHVRDLLDGRASLDDHFGLDDYAKRHRESEARAEVFASRVVARWKALCARIKSADSEAVAT